MIDTPKKSGRVKTNSAKVVFTSFATLLSQGLNSILLIVLIPLLFAGLGERLFGIFQLSQRLARFGGMTNLGASSYLKIRLSELANSNEDLEKRTAVGECILQWLLLIPALLIWIFLVVLLIDAKSPLSLSEELSVILLIAITPLVQILSIGQVALFAEGLGYYGIPLGAALGITATAVAALAAYFGFGLPGVAISLVAGACLRGATTLTVANRMLGWFGIHWPNRAQFKDGFGKSLGASVASLSYLGIQQLESLTFGLALGPVILARLVLTCVGIQFLEIFVRSFIGTAAYGVAPIIKNLNSPKLAALRSETQNNIVSIYALAAPTIVLLTPIVIHFWVPTGNVLKPVVGGAILITSLYRLLSQFDGTLLDQARDFHKKTLAASGLIFIPAALTGYMVGTLHVQFEYWYLVLPVSTGCYFQYTSRRIHRMLSLTAMPSFTILPFIAVVASVVTTEALSRFDIGYLGTVVAAVALTMAIGAIELLIPPLRRAVLRTLTRIVSSIGAALSPRGSA